MEVPRMTRKTFPWKIKRMAFDPVREASSLLIAKLPSCMRLKIMETVIDRIAVSIFAERWKEGLC